MGLVLPKQRRIMVVGCGVLGASLARALSAKGFDITVIDSDAGAFRRLGADFSGFADVGDGTSATVLERNEASEMTMLIATTSRDNLNILVAELARRVYGVGEVYARLYDEHKVCVLEGFGVKVLCPRRLCEDEFAAMSGIDIPGEALR